MKGRVCLDRPITPLIDGVSDCSNLLSYAADLHVTPRKTRLSQNHACPTTSSGDLHQTAKNALGRLSSSHTELQTPSGYMTSLPHVDFPMLEDRELRALVHDNTSGRPKSNHLVAGHMTSQDESGSEVSRYQCPNCPRKYKRKTDLTRHAKTHGTWGRHDCPILTCKFRGRRGNPRQDKFIDHLVRGHPEVETWQCPATGCDREFPSILLLGVHLTGHHRIYSSIGIAIVQAHSIGRSRCPIKGCKKPLTPKHMFGDHSSKERQAEADTLRALGFDHQQSALLCPVCDEKFLCSIEGKEWMNKDLDNLLDHMGVRHLGYGNRFQVPLTHFEDLEPLLSMWKDPHTLYHCQEQLLRIGFYHYYNHAIFDDIRA